MEHALNGHFEQAFVLHVKYHLLIGNVFAWHRRTS